MMATVFFGANDAATGIQHVPLEEYKSNLHAIIGQLREQSSPDLPVVLISPPPIDEEAWKMTQKQDESDRSNDAARQYGIAAREVAISWDSSNTCFVDSWEALEGSDIARSKYLCDGLHLNEPGNEKLHEALVQAIQETFPQLSPMTDGNGRYGSIGIPLEEKLWTELN